MTTSRSPITNPGAKPSQPLGSPPRSTLGASVDLPAISPEYVIDLYHQFLRDSKSVDPSWKPYFDSLWNHPHGMNGRDGFVLAAMRLTDAYRQHGHRAAKTDPLALSEARHPAELEPAACGIDNAVLDSGVRTSMLPGFASTTLHDLVEELREIYCGSIGFDCAHVDDSAARAWLYAMAESGACKPDVNQRVAAVRAVVEASQFEQFLNRRFPAKKRFGAEGAEAIVPWFEAVLARCAEHGVRDAVIGGTARGRLNVMANVMKKSLPALLYEFKGGRIFPEAVKASSDIPYHFGHVTERVFGGATVRVTYCHNPSHLEAIDGVALGRVRARQDAYRSLQEGWQNVLGLLVHTDAAFAGQGVACEVLQLSRLEAYHTGGTIHIVINNQIGFTTNPHEARSAIYCTDFARVIGAPVLHVNADDVDAVVRAANLAADYRKQFNADIVVDLVCYRRAGHNEIDEPTFTQPVMYRKIVDHPLVSEVYKHRVVAAGMLPSEAADAWAQRYLRQLDDAYKAAMAYRPNRVHSLQIEELPRSRQQAAGTPYAANDDTGVSLEKLRTIGEALWQPPPGMAVHPKIERQLHDRLAAIRAGEGISWPVGEALAFASLACEGQDLRFGGQDAPRGAFSQRHFVLFDQETGAAVNLFSRLQPSRGRCDIIGTPLSEYSVLGFEYGYSLDAANALVVWEAQFGDFANVAQVVIDQFVASGEAKWLEASNLVLMLPHGLEGQGPDHSSGRVERFLQMCADDNMVVVNCSTPANLFHVLRRQARARVRKPLILFTPKSLLRHRAAVSALHEFGRGTEFRTVIGSSGSPETVRRVILCSGKIYYDLRSRLAQNIESVAVIRVEQLYPFPAEQLRAELAPYRGAEVVWCQEEPANMGAWSYVDRRIERTLRDVGNPCPWPQCVSRPANASTAIGTSDEHDGDQARLVACAIGLDEVDRKQVARDKH